MRHSILFSFSEAVMKPETKYRRELVKRLEMMFPGAVVTLNDASARQGVPDLTLFYQDKWAMLEVKINPPAAVQPNQAWYVDKFNQMSFARFINPENETEVLYDLQQAFRS